MGAASSYVYRDQRGPGVYDNRPPISPARQGMYEGLASRGRGRTPSARPDRANVDWFPQVHMDMSLAIVITNQFMVDHRLTGDTFAERIPTIDRPTADDTKTEMIPGLQTIVCPISSKFDPDVLC